jgi:ubiquitin-like-conjugating enzyme ATG10
VPRKTQPSGRAEEHEPVKRTLNVTYDILLSPSYRVPVLQFHVRDASGSPVTDHATILSDVVPVDLQRQVADVGVIGGISMTVTADCTSNILS